MWGGGGKGSANPADVTNAANRIATVPLVGVVRTSFLDKGLVAGTPYFYRTRGVGLSGAQTPFSRLLNGVPSADPVTPHGILLMNNGDLQTDSPTVAVSLTVEHHATHYRLSAVRFTGVEPWIPLAASVNSSFGAPPPGSRLRLFGQFRNAAGTISRTVSDDVLYVPGVDTDGDAIPDSADPDDDNDGISDVEEINVLHTDSKRKTPTATATPTARKRRRAAIRWTPPQHPIPMPTVTRTEWNRSMAAGSTTRG